MNNKLYVHLNYSFLVSLPNYMWFDNFYQSPLSIPGFLLNTNLENVMNDERYKQQSKGANKRSKINFYRPYLEA